MLFNDTNSLEEAKVQFEQTKKIFRKWKQTKPKDLDQKFHKEHISEFKKTDCLTCANCCKTTSPIFRDADVRRIAKYMKVKESQFIQSYLKIDEDSDYVLQKSPCAFLGADNKCSIYEIRPLACREYPHTDRKNMYQILELTTENTLICPAVARMVKRITETK